MHTKVDLNYFCGNFFTWIDNLILKLNLHVITPLHFMISILYACQMVFIKEGDYCYIADQPLFNKKHLFGFQTFLKIILGQISTFLCEHKKGENCT